MNRSLGVGLLLFVTLVWGSTFVVTKESLESVPPGLFLALRFSAAALALAWVRPVPGMFRTGLVLGLVMFLSYGSQTVGLYYTSASKGAFITALSVVLVPMFTGISGRRWLPLRVWLAALLALGGLGLMTLTDVSGVNIGDLIIVGTAVTYALHLLLIDRGLRKFPPLQLAAAQLWPVAVLSWLWAAPDVGLIGQLPAGVWWSVLYLALVATALVLVLQNVAQKYVPPHTAALIFVLEPVFAAVFSWLVLGEQLGLYGWLGGILVVGGMVLGEIRPAGTPAVRADEAA
ncbi:MAG TPA: DMT family transporter [Deinococcales bacterium]|nr:DMT family transporter [Deinococcales bacterium]